MFLFFFGGFWSFFGVLRGFWEVFGGFGVLGGLRRKCWALEVFGVFEVFGGFWRFLRFLRFLGSLGSSRFLEFAKDGAEECA